MKIRSKGTAYEIWTELSKNFQNKSCMVSVDLRRRMQEQRTMREDLASMGQSLTKNDFYVIILGSLPSSYNPYISAVSATSSVLGKTLSAGDLMLTITEEYECQNLKSKIGRKDENITFYSNDSGKGRKGGSGSSSKKSSIECFNCHKKGHYAADCWAPGGGKEGQGPKQKGKSKQKPKGGETSAGAKEKSDEIEEAWMVTLDDISETEVEESMPCDNDFDDYLRHGRDIRYRLTRRGLYELHLHPTHEAYRN
ncbi:hypothetical protein BYT27DRAFT_7221343 [Phlegmacium glaucopus]|nr:hypothetical protein BYT27DRAFT_7221343 [Phlegmacium glaucopus]